MFFIDQMVVAARDFATALPGETLLQQESEHPSWITWPTWFAQLGVEPAAALQGPHFNNYTMVIQAAQDGQGIGLGWRRLIGPQLRAGSLRQVTEASVLPAANPRLQPLTGTEATTMCCSASVATMPASRKS